jgi:hypothetical protein
MYHSTVPFQGTRLRCRTCSCLFCSTQTHADHAIGIARSFVYPLLHQRHLGTTGVPAPYGPMPCVSLVNTQRTRLDGRGCWYHCSIVAILFTGGPMPLLSSDAVRQRLPLGSPGVRGKDEHQCPKV